MFEHTPEDVSVKPQPFRMGTPIAQKNSSISRASPAPPLMKKRRRPPVSLFRKAPSTKRSARPRCARRIGSGLAVREKLAPVRTAQLKSARRKGLASLTRAMTAA